jgi:hypothetical protein
MTKITAVHSTVVAVTDRLVVIIEPPIDQKYIVMFARKKTADYRNIRMRSRQKQKKPIKASLITA